MKFICKFKKIVNVHIKMIKSGSHMKIWRELEIILYYKFYLTYNDKKYITKFYLE